MSLRRALDQELDRQGAGTVEVQQEGRGASIDVVEVDRLGVRVRGVRVTHGARDVAERARDLPGRLRSLPERVEAIEVDPGLGGAILRSEPEQMQDDGFFQVDAGATATGVRRYRVRDSGEREEVDWTMTREQLGRLVDELD